MAENPLMTEHGHISSFYHIMAVAVFPEVVSRIENEISIKKLVNGPYMVSKFVGGSGGKYILRCRRRKARCKAVTVFAEKNRVSSTVRLKRHALFDTINRGLQNRDLTFLSKIMNDCCRLCF